MPLRAALSVKRLLPIGRRKGSESGATGGHTITNDNSILADIGNDNSGGTAGSDNSDSEVDEAAGSHDGYESGNMCEAQRLHDDGIHLQLNERVSTEDLLDPVKWPIRDISLHRQLSERHKEAATKRERKQLEKQYGVRYCVMNNLPYFNAIQFHIIDPMHNLLLGTAKRMMTIWRERKMISNKKFIILQRRVNDMKVPCNVGRIPRKIESNFAGFTADQWRTWTTVFSLLALKGCIDNENYQCWALFVRACWLLCSRTMSQSELEEADCYLQCFLQCFVDLYGREMLVPNLHFHLHLKECIQDFGPTYSFWLFSFERMNGLLGSRLTNHWNIETQLLARFLEYQKATWLADQEQSTKDSANVAMQLMSPDGSVKELEQAENHERLKTCH